MHLSPERAEYGRIYCGPAGLSSLSLVFNQGRRALLRVALAPGYHISRLWRSIPTFVQSPEPFNHKDPERTEKSGTRPSRRELVCSYINRSKNRTRLRRSNRERSVKRRHKRRRE